MALGKILVADDDRNIAELLRLYLEKEGYTTELAADGEEAVAKFNADTPDLVLLDIMMPKLDGWQVCREIRKKSNCPIIMITAKGETFDKVLGLELGADDYVTKPFTPMELLARVNSQLRRYSRFMERLGAKEQQEHVYTVGGLELNEDTVEVTVDGELVKMTPIEYKILLLLMKNPGRVFSADEIYERVWNERAINTDTIMVHVRNIREKIEINPREPKYLKVVWGVGYKIEKQA